MKKLVLLILWLFPLLQFSQDFSGLWEGHFSYNFIKDVTQGNNKVFAASDNAIFYTESQTNQIEKITTVEGLSGEIISTIYYSEAYEMLFVGFENGLMNIVFDNETEILTVLDILEKPTISPEEKTINHFNEYQNLLYIATDYGISVYDMERLEFGDTYYIGANGTEIPVTQTTIFENEIYAACLDNNGIKKADISSSNIIDFKNWQSITFGSWSGIETQGDKLYATNVNKKMYRVLNGLITEVVSYTNEPLDLRSVNTNLIVTTQNEVVIYDSDLNVIAQVGIDPSFNTIYTSTTIDQGNIFIGSGHFGVLKTPLTGEVVLEEIHPDGPLLNFPFSIEAEKNGLWVTYGEYDIYYNPYPLNSRGYSHLQHDAWVNVPYNDVLDAKCLNAIAVNPSKNNQVFISSYFSGLLEINDNITTFLYNETNSGLESMEIPSNPDYIDIRVGPSVFDEDGFLWTLSARIDAPLKSFDLKNNQWKSYDFTKVIGEGLSGGNLGYSDLVIDSNGTKWVGSFYYGIIGFNENNGSPLIKGVYSEEQNMPSRDVTALALDKREQLWIGTNSGLRVLNNVSHFFADPNISVDNIIIEEDGVAKELLYEQDITAITVDGSNNKWVATSGAGLFYFTPDGQTTIFHFTTENSPLPSNSIRDIAIDGSSGVLYVATEKGLVSFLAGGSSPIANLEKAFAYPNPVRPGFNMVEDKIKIKDISENVNIKITDIEGNLVGEAASDTNQRYSGYNLEIDGGTAYWNGKNLSNNLVASGVYLVMLSDLDTFETKVIKLMIIR